MDDAYDKIKPRFEMILAHLSSGGGESGLCRKLGVSRSEFRRCRREHPELDELWKLGKAEVAERVEAALLKRATGYEEEGGKAVPPDVRAAVFWLKNRRPARWNDGAGAEKKTAAGNFSLTAEEKQL